MCNAGSDNHVRATAIAAVGEGQYQHQEWILRQAFADTADSAYLEKHAAKYGIYRKTATFAGGKVRVRGAVGATVPVGQQINVGDKVYFSRRIRRYRCAWKCRNSRYRHCFG